MDDNLGICQEGNAPTFVEVFEDVCKTFPTGITYVEIGVGAGGTLLWVARYLKKYLQDWRAIGIDLPDGYSLCAHALVNACARDKFFMRMVRDEVKDVSNPKPWSALGQGVTLVLAPSQAAFRIFWPQGLPIHVALIDGCHGRACVMGDFLALEPLIEIGGYVLFHDYEVLGESQPHCGTEDTLGACEELGLPFNGRRNWKFVKVSTPDKSRGGRAIGVFKKVPVESSIAQSDAFYRATGS